MYTIKKEKAEKITVQATGEQLISVTFSILDENENVVSVQAHGFSLDTEKDVIDKEIEKAMETFCSDKVITDKIEKVAELNIKADETIGKINEEINN